MLRIIKKLIVSLLAFAVVVSAVPSASASAKQAPSPAYFDLPVTVDVIKVGLRSGASALYEANIQNKAGSGFKFGYFDYARQFHELGKTAVTSLAIRGDLGFTLADGMVVGPWHMILNKEFSSFKSAKSYAETLWGGFPGYINGEYRVLVGAYADADATCSEIARRNIDAVAFTGSEYSILAAQSGTSELQFLIDNGEKTNLAVKPASKTDKAETWFAGNAYHGDFQFVRIGSGVSVINYVQLEDYVKGVLPYEMHGDWPAEALKAQGACARTYALNNINSYYDKGFDVRNDTYSQVYRGVTGTIESTNEAAAATAGDFVRFRGSICKIYYMSSDGGATDSSANVFAQKRAYMQGVKDKNEKNIDFYNKTWRRELLDENILYRLSANGYELKDIADIEAVKSDMGNVIELHISDSDKNTVSLYGEDCFRVTGLNSLNYNISSYKTELDVRVWVIEGKGWGHNCGMSQWGAYGMAQDNAVKCGDIIDFYFSGAYLG